jgi:hypothetical protein
LCQAAHSPRSRRPPRPPAQRPFVIVFSDLDTSLIDLCYTLVIIGFDKEVIPISEGAEVSMGTLRTLFTKNEPIEREDWTVVLKKLVDALAPSAQPFRMGGKGFPGRGSGPRLTDRKHYK